MLGPYRDILSRPGTLAFSAAGVVARLPMSVLGLGVVLLVSTSYGSYALAGRVAAAYVVAQAICAPQLGRWVDRFGQARIMRPALLLASTGLASLVVAGTLRAPVWTLYVTAAVTGATLGSMGALVRARWSHVLRDDRKVETAFALESVLDEVVFAIGPVAVTFLASAIAPPAALVLPLVATVGGGFWFLAQRQTEPPPTGRTSAGRTRSVLRTPGMAALALVFIAVGGVFGATEVATVAFAEEQGSIGYAGPVLAAFALGSLGAGLVYGSRSWLSPLRLRFLLAVVALGVGTSAFLLVDSVVQLAGVMLLAGLAIAPTLIAGNGLVQGLVPPGRLTEGLTWVGTMLGVGVSFSASIAGAAIDEQGSRAGFVVVALAALSAVVLTGASMALLRPRPAAWQSSGHDGRAEDQPEQVGGERGPEPDGELTQRPGDGRGAGQDADGRTGEQEGEPDQHRRHDDGGAPL